LAPPGNGKKRQPAVSGENGLINSNTKEDAMKRVLCCMVMVVCLLTGGTLWAFDDVEETPSCKYCGMDRTAFAHSRMVVTYADDSSTGTCSINCVVTDMKETKKEVKSFQVADYNTKKLTDAKTATWVIGGKKKGVMAPVAKWAFAKKKDAKAFIKANSGNLATFDEALKVAEKDEADRAKSKKPQEHKGHGGHK
jgi:copper chaperone NosL